MRRKITLRIGACYVTINGNGSVDTLFPDGKTASADVHDSPEYLKKARSLGYGSSTRLMCVHKEVLHTWLAVRYGFEWSPVLAGIAGFKDCPTIENAESEETDVANCMKSIMLGRLDNPIVREARAYLHQQGLLQ